MLVVCTHKELHKKRWELFKKLNGDVFWPMCQWPRKFRRIIWKKPLNDKETFQVALFLLGNGCSNFVVVEWILISQLMWTVNPKIWEKRARQLEFIIKNIDQRKDSWFYYDIYHGGLLYFNGCRKNQQPFEKNEEKADSLSTNPVFMKCKEM